MASAMALSVMMVAGLELTRTVSTPSCFSTRQALGAGIVEFRCLPDHNRAGADDHDLLNGWILRHYKPSFIMSVKRSKAVKVSKGAAVGLGVELDRKGVVRSG